MGTGELRMIHSRVAWMSAPVDRSITVSAPHCVDHVSLSTSSAIDDVTAWCILAFVVAVLQNVLQQAGENSGGIQALLNMFSGGAFAQLAVFAVFQPAPADALLHHPHAWDQLPDVPLTLAGPAARATSDVAAPAP